MPYRLGSTTRSRHWPRHRPRNTTRCNAPPNSDLVCCGLQSEVTALQESVDEAHRASRTARQTRAAAERQVATAERRLAMLDPAQS